MLLGVYTRSVIHSQEDMRGQLQLIADPSPLVKQLMGAHMHRTRDFNDIL